MLIINLRKKTKKVYVEVLPAFRSRSAEARSRTQVTFRSFRKGQNSDY